MRDSSDRNGASATPAGAAGTDARAELVPAVAATAADLVSADELAAELGVSRSTIDRRRRRGELAAVQTPGGYAFRRTVTLEMGELRRSSGAVDRGELASRLFPLLRALTPLDECVERLGADPALVKALFLQYAELCAMSAAWLKPAQQAAPKFDHQANADASCCAGHEAQRRMQKKESNAA